MDLKKMTNEELEYELVDVNQKLAELSEAKRRGSHVPEKKIKNYINYKREILREMRARS